MNEMTAADLERLRVRELLDLQSLPTREAAMDEVGAPLGQLRRRDLAPARERRELPIDRGELGQD